MEKSFSECVCTFSNVEMTTTEFYLQYERVWGGADAVRSRLQVNPGGDVTLDSGGFMGVRPTPPPTPIPVFSPAPPVGPLPGKGPACMKALCRLALLSERFSGALVAGFLHVAAASC